MFYTNKMLFYALCAFSVAVFGFGTAEKLALPSIPTCKQNSANYYDCLKDAIQEAWPQFVKGLSEFDVPPVDPLIFKLGKFAFDRDLVHGEVILTNLTAYGLANTHFMSVRSNHHNDVFRLEIDIQIPNVHGEGDCSAEGSFGAIKMGGKGHYNFTADDIKGTWIITGPVRNDTWIIEHFYVAPSVKKVKVYLFDFFNGNKELNDLAMNFVNEFWPSFYRILLPIMTETWDPWFTEITNRFFSKVSFAEIFS